jgi:MoaA/NifB/PqqE/SkfB family radical SAM enzyme
MSTSGILRPCCNFQSIDDFNLIDVKDIKHYNRSDYIKSIENVLNRKQWPLGCYDCRVAEENGIESLRTDGFDKYKNNRKDAEVKFGNLCNLACVMCTPTNSSLVDLETRELQKTETMEFIQTRKLYSNNVEWYTDNRLLEEVAEFLSDRDEIRFTGGEPTVNNYLSKFLDFLIKYNSKTTIRLTTNGNNWPNRLHEQLSNFSVKVDISIDGYGDINEYIRWPSRWSNIEKNVKKIKEISEKTSCYTTVACYNMHTLPDLCKWVQQAEFDKHDLNPVTSPTFMNTIHANRYSKDIYIALAEWYMPANSIKSFVLTPGNTENLKKVVEYFTILDNTRNTNIDILGKEWRQYD